MIASLLAASALFADAAQLDCPLTIISPAERATVEQAVAERRPGTDPRLQVVYRSVLVCAQRHGWSRHAVGVASGYIFTAIAVDTARRALATRGIDVAELERMLLADAELRALPEGAEALRAGVNGFFQRHQAYLVGLAGPRPRDPEEIFSLIGVFMASRVAMEVSRASFAQG
jgi:hypothetical protein